MAESPLILLGIPGGDPKQPDLPSSSMLTESGDPMITEGGDFMIVE